MDALVADADLVGAAAGLRGLAAAGRRSVVLGTHRLDAALLSRHAAARALGPDPSTDPAGFAARVGDLAQAHGGLVVYPSREETIDALLGHRLAPEVQLPFPATDAVALLRDKRRLAELGAAAGLRAPATVAEGPAGELLTAEHPTPLLVKPTRRGIGVPEVTVARTPGELRARLLAFAPDEPVLLQEAVSGDLLCVAVVVDREGRLVERFQQAVARVWPRGAGAAATAVSVAPDEELCRASARMVGAAGYWGMAQVDFMDADDGPLVIDVNPRFYISLGLANACGVNLPGAWHAVVRGEPAGPPSPYRTGVGYRRLESDVSAAVRGEPGLLLDRPARPVVGSVWSRTDPLPAAGLVARRIGQSLHKRIVTRRPGATAAELDVRVCEPDERFAADWRALEGDAQAAPYLCWDWLEAWRDVYRPAALLGVRIAPSAGGPPVALGLLEPRRLGRWRFAGAPVTPIRGLLARDADSGRAWAALAAALSGRAPSWASLELAGVHAAAAALPGAQLERTSTWALDLPGTFEDYLAQRSASRRKGHKQKLRRLAREGGEVVPIPDAERGAGLAEFIRLHRLRARAKGEHHPQMDDRLIDLLRRMERSDSIDLRLFALRVGDRIGGITVRLDRPAIGAAWFYNGGMDPEFERLGPGVTLELHSIRDAIERGYRRFDLGIGYWRYKEDLGGLEVLLCSGVAFAPGTKGALMRATTTAAHQLRSRSPAAVRELYRRSRSRLSTGRSLARRA